MKKFLKTLTVISGSAFAMFLITLASDAVTRSVIPIWHEEPQMPQCLKAKIK